MEGGAYGRVLMCFPFRRKWVIWIKGDITNTSYTHNSVQESEYKQLQWILFCSYNQLWVFTINGNALHHTKLIMAIFTDQLPFSTENLDGRWETNMYLFPSIQSPLGVLSHSHHMWNIPTWQVNFDLATCCTVKQVIVINTEWETIAHGVCEIMSLWCHCLGCTVHVQRSLYLCS